jgi:hypothetical protein
VNVPVITSVQRRNQAVKADIRLVAPAIVDGILSYGAGAQFEFDRPPSLLTKISKPRKYIVFPVSSSTMVAGQFVHLNDVEFAGSVKV